MFLVWSYIAFFFTLDYPAALGTHTNGPITSHVLDTSAGRPAVGVTISFFKQLGSRWFIITTQDTNKDGRVGNLIKRDHLLPGIYKLNFNTRSYYGKRNATTFFPEIDIIFEIEKVEEHYHVPLLLSAYGYTTYRGS